MKPFLCNCTLRTIFYWKGTLSCSVFKEEEKPIQLMCEVLAAGTTRQGCGTYLYLSGNSLHVGNGAKNTPNLSEP